MNAINLDTATKAEITAVAKKPSSAKAKREAPSKGLVIDAATGAVKPKATTKPTMTDAERAAAKAARYPSAAKADEATKAPEAKPEAGNGAFTAIAGSLSATEAEAAEQAAITAIRKAKKPAPQIAAARPALTQRYSVSGNYKGKTGAMFAFMGRCATLGDTFSREDAVASMTAKPPHEALTTRAQVLDYFAWAARHVLVYVAKDQSVPAATPAKATKKSGKGAKKA